MMTPQTPEGAYPQIVNNEIFIVAPSATVWAALTEPDLMRQWMSPDSPIEITTDWVVGHTITVCGPWYKTSFENKGMVTAYMPEQHMAYSHLSSLSRLPDVAANYTELSFRLSAEPDGTLLAVTLSNFPTQAIYHHFAYYWNVTLHVLKRFVEAAAFRN